MNVDLMRQELENRKKTTNDFGAYGKKGFDDYVKGRQTLIDVAQKEVTEQTDAITKYIQNQNQKIVQSILNPSKTSPTGSGNNNNTAPTGSGNNKNTAIAKVVGPAKGPNAPLTFNNPADLFPEKINSEATLKQEEAHWYNYATSVEEANKRAAEATEQASQQMAQAIGGTVQQSLFSLSDAMTRTMQNSEDSLTRFEGALANTALKLIAMALSTSISNAIVGATASGAATGPAAIFTTPAFIAEAVGGILGAFAAIPKFAMGGVADSFYGDRMPALVNKGEMILNTGQQRNLFGMIKNNRISGGGGVQLIPIIDNRGLAVQVRLGEKQLGRG
jgi:hypothetical protein